MGMTPNKPAWTCEPEYPCEICRAHLSGKCCCDSSYKDTFCSEPLRVFPAARFAILPVPASELAVRGLRQYPEDTEISSLRWSLMHFPRNCIFLVEERSWLP